MIRALLLAVFLMLGAAGGACAQVTTCTVPFFLQNGTVADANQVMGDFNAITGCVNTVASTSASLGNQFDVANYNAIADSTTDQSANFASAFAACSAAGGGTVITKPGPAGKMYVIQHANLIAAAWTGPCTWKFIGGHYWPANFYDNTPGDWAAKGAWIWCQDTANSCARMTAPGQGVIGGNFWYTQPTPSSTTCAATPCLFGAGWTPTVYPATITADTTTNFYKIQDNMIVNAYQCLDIEGPASGIANMYSSIADNYLGCLNNDIVFNRVDNTLDISHNHEFLLWYQGSTQVLGYAETIGGIAWNANYLANVQVHGGEIVWKRIGILLTDQTVVNGFGSLTFAGANWKVNGLEFNEVCQAIKVASPTTHFNGGPVGNAVGINVFSNIGATVDTATSGIPTGTSTTVTISIASPAVISWPAHGLSVGQGVAFSTTGALPTGITAGKAYYVISAGLGTNSFEIATAPGGTAINTSGVQSGVQTGTTGAPQCAAATPNLFDFGSDNASVMFEGLNVGFANTVFNLGAGSSGFLEVGGISVQQYSAYTANLPAFQGAANAAFELCRDQFRVTPASGAGPYTSGGLSIPCSMSAGGQIGGPMGTTRQLTFGTNPQNPTSADFGTSYRWGIRADSTNEPGAGSNLGSNFEIDRYADGGTVLDSPIFINRQTGQVFMPDGLRLTLPASAPNGTPAGTICFDSIGQLYAKATCP